MVKDHTDSERGNNVKMESAVNDECNVNGTMAKRLRSIMAKMDCDPWLADVVNKFTRSHLTALGIKGLYSDEHWLYVLGR